jgi:sulfhydrogenase subunit beta (sulfur reductase)
MRYIKLKKGRMSEFLESLKPYGSLIAPIRVSEKSIDFREISDVNQVIFDYQRSLMPPKRFFYLTKETLFSYNREKVEMNENFENPGPIVLFGVHSCDIIGLRIIDANFIDENPDSYYQRRRENSIIVGISCWPDEYCFCNVRKAEFADKGFDLFLSEVSDGYVIRVGSVKGHKIIDPNLKLYEEVTEKDANELVEYDRKKQSKFTVSGNWDSLRYNLELKDKLPLWAKESEKCLGCGNCTITCPTCRCYDVKDYPNLDAITGKRIRFWDSCQFRSHGLVAGGYNFRETKENRFKNRYMCKNSYCTQLTTAFCVGCGRCTYFCPAEINYKKNLIEIQGVR